MSTLLRTGLRTGLRSGSRDGATARTRLIGEPGRRTTGLSRTATGSPVPSAAARARRLVPGDPALAWVGTVAVTLLALFLRLWHLGRPHAFEFDETYYAKDAWSLIHHGYVTGYVDGANDAILDGRPLGLWTHDPSLVVHPELGKWLIGAGEALFGMTPFGWRVVPAVVGSLMVAVMVRLARRVTGSTLLGLTAGLLLCFDGLQLVLSRLALLDIFVAFFMLLAVSCHVADRDQMRARIAEQVPSGTRLHPSSWGPRLLWRPWLLTAGVWWGLALSCKWSAMYTLAALALLSWAWSAGARRSFGVRRAWAKSVLLDALPGLGYVVVLPVMVYVLSWTGWLMHASVYEASLSSTPYGPPWGAYVKTPYPHGFLPELVRSLRSLWHYHVTVYAFHDHGLVGATHVYQSNPWGWPILNRPVGVDAQLGISPGDQGCTAATGSTCLRQVLLLGTPAVWWFGSAAAIWSVVAWVGRRDWRHGLVVLPLLLGWLPWFRYDDRPIFSYYAVMLLPFLVLAAVMLLGEMLGQGARHSTRRRVGAAAAGVVVVAVALNLAWFWPIYTDGLLTQSQWLERIWFKRWI